MKVVEILQELKSNPGSNAKKEVLERHSKNNNQSQIFIETPYRNQLLFDEKYLHYR